MNLESTAPCRAILPLGYAILAALLTAGTWAQPQPVPQPGPVPDRNLSFRLELRRAIDRGCAWLENAQHSEGYWSTADHPAISALALTALRGAPGADDTDQAAARRSIEPGYRFLLSCARPDGGIYGKKELVNYNTSVSLMALLAAEKAEYRSVILDARNFLVGLQWDFDEPGKTDHPLDGGIGYGSTYPHSDMSNTMHALEALFHSERLLPEGDLAAARKLNWNAALHFIQNCQNLPEYNNQPWASDDRSNHGGFVYFPGDSKAGEMTLDDGRVALRSYGSISYAGMLSYIYAKLDRDDPRVTAVLEWVKRNYTLEENPGMGPQGLYFYFHTMTKALSLYGVDTLQVNGASHDWRKELGLKLLDLQRPDGSWMNDNGRWWERDPALVTAYALLSLEMIHHSL